MKRLFSFQVIYFTLGSHGLHCVICDRLEWGSCPEVKTCDGTVLFSWWRSGETRQVKRAIKVTPGELCSCGGSYLGETRASLHQTL